MHHATIFASVYGDKTYNTDTYNGATTTGTGTGSGSGSGSGGGGVLANTGFDILLAVTAACLILLAAMIVRIVRRPGTTKG